MSNILKVTTPIMGHDNTNQVRTGAIRNTDPSIHAPVTPDKVVRPDQRGDSNPSDQSIGMKFRYESNYDNFLAQLSKMPEMTEEFTRLFFERFSTIAESGIGEDTAANIAKFFEMISLEESEIASFLKDQGKATIRFNGSFFELLRQAMRNSSSVEFRAGVLEFLKRYVDMAETPHVSTNISNTMTRLTNYLFPASREEFLEMLAKFDSTGTNKEGNISLLKDDVMPFLNKQVTRHNNRGNLREMSVLISAYTARLENGMPNRVMEAFEQLMRYQSMQKAFQNFDSSMLFSVLESTDFKKSTDRQKWMVGLSEMVELGMSPNAGAENRAVFQNLMQSVLLGESVYMPILHMMLPMQVNGKLTFAQMWIDPDADKQNNEGGREKTVQGLVKFDISDVGFFDLYFVYKSGDIRMQISCPDEIVEDADKIKNDLSSILATYSIKISEMFVDASETSIPISTAFPKIFERKNSVNVSI